MLQENSNEASFLSTSKWEVSDNEARMGEFDDLCDDFAGKAKLTKIWRNTDTKLFQPNWTARLRKSRAD